MQTKRLLFFVGLMVMVTAVGFASNGWAGGTEDQPSTGTIDPPELWGEMIIDCGARDLVILRVKRIVDCEVQTQAFISTLGQLGCPADESTPRWRKLGVTIFDINPDPAVLDPIITKVKNFKEEPGGQNLFSFDVQIKFYNPSGTP